MSWLLVIGLVAGDDPGPTFRDVAEASGIHFRFHAGSRGKHDLPEIMGGGAALLDFDGDGDLDVYLCDGGPIVPGPNQPDPPCRLFRNDGDWHFRDVTEAANAPGPSYAMGSAVGDFDGDGRDDLLVTGWRDQRLYRNLGDGSFANVTERAGLASKLWGTSAAFADLDGDGDLDLYVCRYLDFNPEKAPFCAAPDGKPDYCGPEDFDSQPDALYRNNGDGTFTDVAEVAGIIDPRGRGLGVLIADFTGDAKPDVFVANDGTACRLYENRGDLHFVDVAERAGVAFDGSGRALAGMGAAAGDIDGDGRVDLVASNFLGRSTVGFLNVRSGLFADESSALGLAAPTRSVLGFGLGLTDFDGDGDLDLLQANGHVLDRARLGEPMAMRPTLLANRGGRFAAVDGGPFFERAIVGRGVAIGDLDGDGRPDAIVASLDAPAAVLRNESPGRFVSLDVRGRSGRVAVGAVVRVTIGGRTLARPVVAGGSYLSASPATIAVGLGSARAVDGIEVAWPSGRAERFAPVPESSNIELREGCGTTQ